MKYIYIIFQTRTLASVRTDHKLLDNEVHEKKIHHKINNKMVNTILLGFRDIFMGDTNFSD